MAATAPPSHLSAPARHLWRDLVEEYGLEDDAAVLDILRVALEARDRAATARRTIAREGIVIEGRFGRIQHPALAIEKQAAERYHRIMRDLALTAPEEEASGDRRYLHSKHQRGSR